MVQAVGAEIGPDLQVLQHGEVGEHVPPLRDQRDPLGDDAVRGQGGNILSLKPDAARSRLHQARDGPQDRGFARTVGADEGDDLPLRHLKINALNSLNAAVVHPQAIYFKHRQPPPNTPG